ncbi:MAG: hypothetical protein N4R10_04220, partial [Lactobacillus iners]|nr:hypothetical protein [Lactobacillus iners]
TGARVFVLPELAEVLQDRGVRFNLVESEATLMQMLKEKKFNLVINNMSRDSEPESFGFKLRQMAISQNISLITALDTVDAILIAISNDTLTTKPLA